MVLALGYYALRSDAKVADQITREATPEERGKKLRRAALERCQAREYELCLQGLDRAKAIDPSGDASND